MNVLGHKYLLGDFEGSSFGGQTEADMIVVGVHVKDARGATVRIGPHRADAKPGVTRCEPCWQIKSGTAIAIDLDGEGSVEVLGVRVPRGKVSGPIEQGKPCPLCGVTVGDPVEHRCVG